MANPPENKEQWLRVLKETAIPSFGSSIQALSSVTAYSEKHSSELARVILKDPNLTASVLKLANSVVFNAGGRTIRTISRAIMILGFQAVKEVCASCLLIETFSKNSSSQKLKALLARSYHSAIQAKQIAFLSGQKSTEEIFISALLLNLGEISVYSSIDKQHEIYPQLSEAYPLVDGKEREIIGCYFKDLTLGLCQSWNIAPMIGEVIGGHYAENSPLRCVLLGQNFASSCETVGLEKTLVKYTKPIALYTRKTPELVAEKVIAATDETQKSLLQLGLELDIKSASFSASSDSTLKADIKIDKLLQLDVILELTQIVQDSVNINEVLPQILEGIQRGGGFSNALVGLLNPDRSRLTAKYALETSQDSVKDSFHFSCYHDIPEIQQKVLTNKSTILQTELREKGMTLKQILKRTATRNAIWGPLIVENKVIGCFYADNGKDGPPVTQEQLEIFQMFVYQAKLFMHKLK